MPWARQKKKRFLLGISHSGKLFCALLSSPLHPPLCGATALLWVVRIPCSDPARQLPFCRQNLPGSVVLFFFFFFVFLGLYLWHMESPSLGVKSEVQLPACTTATATQDPRCVFDLHHSSRQCWNLNPLTEARGRTCILMDTSWICYRCATTETPVLFYSYLYIFYL